MTRPEEPRKLLPARSSRGTRITKLVGEEAEADETFWGQDAWREDEEDDDYSTEEEEEDIVDADFDEEEDPDEDVHDADEDDGPAKKRPTRSAQRGAYREPTQQQRKKPRLAKLESMIVGIAVEQQQPQDNSTSAALPPHTPTTASFQYEAPTVRRSTARKSSESSELRKKITQETARLLAGRVAKTDAKGAMATVTRVRLTQSQLLAEAVRTEVENMQSLSRLEQQEEEKKAETMTPKAPFTGEMVRFHSRIGAPKTITFLNSVDFPPIFNQPKPKKRERRQEQQRPEEDGEEEEGDEGQDGDGEKIAT
uniref:Vps72/YL1 N-terminal domain-containing protein n=1 Tax=Globisporangium ultimum (strain ATCC 200006 / CBS 805.95 / DAOM BR144) TaxID=431595 RepID=K3X7B2_GLOUD